MFTLPYYVELARQFLTIYLQPSLSYIAFFYFVYITECIINTSYNLEVIGGLGIIYQLIDVGSTTWVLRGQTIFILP